MAHVPSTAWPSSSDVIAKARLPLCSGCFWIKRSGRNHQGRQTGFHVGGAATIQVAVFYCWRERVGIPALQGAWHHHIGMTGQHQTRALCCYLLFSPRYWSPPLREQSSMTNPLHIKRSRSSCWQPLSSGVIDALDIKSLLSANTSSATSCCSKVSRVWHWDFLKRWGENGKFMAA